MKAALIALPVLIITVASGAFVAVRGSYLVGVRRGLSARNRYLHDTVLQTLEALGVASPSDPIHAAARLAELRRVARAQAAELRRGLADPAGATRSGPLGQELAALVAELAAEGLRARLELAGTPVRLSSRRRAALRDATGEALRNTLKHSGTEHAIVRVEHHDGGVAVSTRDYGIGFRPGERSGFGIAESIVTRMAEVGGRADIESRPGWGTRVAVWAPR